MASEQQISILIKSTKGGASLDSSGGAAYAKVHDQSGADMASETQVITQAADVALAIPAAVSPVGELVIENLDATNYIELSNATGGSFAGGKFGKIRAGRRAVFQPSGTIYAKANTADVRIKFSAFEE